jgi:MoaA/NifB/PqqE/SkfB family radical SAM enzyme
MNDNKQADATRLRGKVDQEGRLLLDAADAAQYGLSPGTEFFLEDGTDGLTIVRPATNLAKVYIEATNACNLQCRTCIRNSWDESTGRMSMETFGRIVEGLKGFPSPPSVFFGGFGEPLFHPSIVDMVAAVKGIGSKVELITNATLLAREMSERLVDAGLDGIWISLDGARPESFADVRLGAALPEILENATGFRDACSPEFRSAEEPCSPELRLYPDNVAIGIVFVAMKRNIADLPRVVSLGEQFGATRFLVTNVLPYTREMCNEVLYSSSLTKTGGDSSLFRVIFPLMDPSETSAETIREVSGLYDLVRPAASHAGPGNRCPFVRKGAAVINWQGNMSPCIPLMYDTVSYRVDGRKRLAKKYHVGNLSDETLQELWTDPGYVDFRKRVQVFDFPPCTRCECQLSETNEEDCFGNLLPTCGGCLWAQGIVQCP